MRGRKIQTLRAIVEVRGVQRAAAELAAGQSEQHLRERRHRHDEAVAQCESDQTEWANCLSEGSAGLTLAAAWARQVLISESDQRISRDELERAVCEKDERTEAWRLAQARVDTARTMARKAALRVQRLREEAALAELADRTTLRGAPR